MIDYPEKIAAIGFTQGCNFRCPYCHNPELVEPEQFTDTLSEEKILEFLEERQGKLEGVVITGGEPTMQSGLLSFVKKVKAMGFLIKLDTNGSAPGVLAEIIKDGSLDYIAMDIKAPFEKYESVSRTAVDAEDIKKSIALIMNSGLPYEFRTTVVNMLLSPADIISIAREIMGARLYVLQKFLPTKTIDPEYLAADTYTDDEFENIRQSVVGLVKECEVR